ncbi:MAG: GFA family protein [Acidobacteria bacterium]|nr:GFA family protein [Acidobacteriota bacterium]MCB9396560.1 GFA family protein [Acidobacteriota bacterium]
MFQGSCMCQLVQYQFTGPSLWCAHCHCTDCRAAHGAAFVTWFGVDEADFKLTAGESALRWYTSSPGARRGFCATCGTTLFFQAERWKGEMHITLASLATALDRAPQAQVFWDSHVAWLPDPVLPRYGGPSGTEPQ